MHLLTHAVVAPPKPRPTIQRTLEDKPPVFSLPSSEPVVQPPAAPSKAPRKERQALGPSVAPLPALNIIKKSFKLTHDRTSSTSSSASTFSTVSRPASSTSSHTDAEDAAPEVVPPPQAQSCRQAARQRHPAATSRECRTNCVHSYGRLCSPGDVVEKTRAADQSGARPFLHENYNIHPDDPGIQPSAPQRCPCDKQPFSPFDSQFYVTTQAECFASSDRSLAIDVVFQHRRHALCAPSTCLSPSGPIQEQHDQHRTQALTSLVLDMRFHLSICCAS